MHKPVEYYAAYFTVRGEDFDGATVVKGRDAVKRKMGEIAAKGKEATAKEEAAYSTFQIVNEMLARGIEVLPIDLYKSDARKYLVEGGRIRLPFSSLAGVGDAAATALAEARESGGPSPFVASRHFPRTAGESSRSPAPGRPARGPSPFVTS